MAPPYNITLQLSEGMMHAFVVSPFTLYNEQDCVSYRLAQDHKMCSFEVGS